MKLYTYLPRLHTRGDLSNETTFDAYQRGFHIIDLTPRGSTFAKDIMGSKYHHHPLSDGQVTEKNLEAAQHAAFEAVDLWTEGNEVIVHCHAGRNRACFVMGLALYDINIGWTGKKVVDYIRGIRPNALANVHFEEHLRSLP